MSDEDTNPQPHPGAWPWYVLRWAYTCAGCGTSHRFGWHEYSDETGEHLYCYRCSWYEEVKAPHTTYEGTDWQGNPATRTRPLWEWCRHLQRVFPIPEGSWTDRHADHLAVVAAEQPPRVYVCDWCNTKFTPARSDARFCSTRCRVASHRSGQPPT